MKCNVTHFLSCYFHKQKIHLWSAPDFWMLLALYKGTNAKLNMLLKRSALLSLWGRGEGLCMSLLHIIYLNFLCLPSPQPQCRIQIWIFQWFFFFFSLRHVFFETFFPAQLCLSFPMIFSKGSNHWEWKFMKWPQCSSIFLQKNLALKDFLKKQGGKN